MNGRSTNEEEQEKWSQTKRMKKKDPAI